MGRKGKERALPPPPPRPGPAPTPTPDPNPSPQGRQGRQRDSDRKPASAPGPDPTRERPPKKVRGRDWEPAPAPAPAPAPDRSTKKGRDGSSGRSPAPAPAPAPATSGPPRPRAPVAVQEEDGAWQTKLFHCFKDVPSCLWTLFVPCFAFGQIAEILDEGQPRCMCHALMYVVRVATAYTPCFMSFRYRTKLRKKFGLQEEPCNDFCVHLFCELCALAQEYRELTLRGIDPSKGWEGYQRSLEAPQAVEMRR